MLNLTFTVNNAAIKRAVDAQARNSFLTLSDRDDKTFSVKLAGKEYQLRYSISDTGVADIFLITDDDRQFARPMLRLNVGSFLLPESMVIDPRDPGLNPGADNSVVPEYDTLGIPDSEKEALKKHIQAVGLKNLVTNSRNNSQK